MKAWAQDIHNKETVQHAQAELLAVSKANAAAIA